MSELALGAVAGSRPGALVDDLAIAAGLGLDHVRITVSWARAQPRAGAVDGGVVEEVRAAVATAHGAGLRVRVCLLTPEVPRWFDDEGGFTDARTAGHWWPRWVQAAADAFGDDVDGWVPFEAPYAIAQRLVPSDPRRHGELVDTLVVAWRDAWRILHGPAPVATSLDVKVVRIPAAGEPAPAGAPAGVTAAEVARRDDHLRWHTWLRALRDGTVTIPGRADRELADLAGACDVLGIAVSGGTGTDLEPLLHRCAEQGPDRPLAVTFRPTGPDLDARAEAVATVLGRARGLASSVPLHHVTVTDLDALAHSLS